MTALELAGYFFIGLGVVLIVIAAVGLLKLPDVYNRANAVAKAASLGLVSVLLGVVVLAPTPSAIVTLLLAGALQIFTVPIAGHKIGEAAYLSGAPLAPQTHRDDLHRWGLGRPSGGGSPGPA